MRKAMWRCGVRDGSTGSTRVETVVLVCLLTVAGFLLGDTRLSALTCTSYDPGCRDDGAVVPCSNTDFCYTAPTGILCDDGATVTNYKNSGPPSSWALCVTNPGGQGKCTNAATDCGTVIYYNGPCGAGGSRSCDITKSTTKVQFCKANVPSPVCSPAPP